MYWRNKIRDGNPEYGRLRTRIGETKSGMGTLSMGGCVHVFGGFSFLLILSYL